MLSLNYHRCYEHLLSVPEETLRINGTIKSAKTVYCNLHSKIKHRCYNSKDFLGQTTRKIALKDRKLGRGTRPTIVSPATGLKGSIPTNGRLHERFDLIEFQFRERNNSRPNAVL